MVSFGRLKVAYRFLDSVSSCQTSELSVPQTPRARAAKPRSTLPRRLTTPVPRKGKPRASSTRARQAYAQARETPADDGGRSTAELKPTALTTLRFATAVVVRSSVSSSSSSSSSSFPSAPQKPTDASTHTASASNRPSALTRSGPSTTATRHTHVARHASSDSDESDGYGDVDDFLPRYHYRTHSQTVFGTYARLVKCLRLERATAS